MYETNAGSISIDGVNVNHINVQQLRKEIGYVQQDVFLFSDSVENNIRFGLTNLVGKEEIYKAAEAAHVLNEINSLPNQFETLVGERGTTLSGGQKQRVAIARSLIKNPSIYIFDDCLSALDTKTEAEILENIKAIGENKTVITVSHRPSSLKDCDYILVLDEGTIVEAGTHEELLSKMGIYQAIFDKQLSSDGVLNK
jgi:ATP-binding cassette subfamily B protein